MYHAACKCWVSTIQSVVLTADVCQFIYKKKNNSLYNDLAWPFRVNRRSQGELVLLVVGHTCVVPGTSCLDDDATSMPTRTHIYLWITRLPTPVDLVSRTRSSVSSVKCLSRAMAYVYRYRARRDVVLHITEKYTSTTDCFTLSAHSENRAQHVLKKVLYILPCPCACILSAFPETDRRPNTSTRMY